ncbi:MAG: hypothetical protein V7K40_15965 [Nostoc sp.]|uniref:hypothetical protein n=1 Tax=Nostoc sp. TaxID=1180 RepID=UPI002FFA2F03
MKIFEVSNCANTISDACGGLHQRKGLPNKKIINRFGKQGEQGEQGEKKSDSRIGLQKLSNLILEVPKAS